MAEAVTAVRLDALLREIAAVLHEAGIGSARREARLLVEYLAGVSGNEIVSRPEREIGAHAYRAVLAAARRRAAGEPLHRIVGRRAFYGIELALSPATLEPRPDTEILVDRIIPHVRRIAAKCNECRLLDLGTGTGAIALAVLAEVPGAVATGADIHSEAVVTARENALANGLADRFKAIRSNWFEAIDEKFHVIVSNPPYISKEEYDALPEEVRRFDPKTALLGGTDGLDAYRAIAESAAAHLLAGGVLGVEIGYSQREAVTGIFEPQGLRLVEQARDLAGHDRALIFEPEPGPNDAMQKGLGNQEDCV